MGKVKFLFSWTGRFLISFFFVMSALSRMMDWQESESMVVSLLGDWYSHLSNFPAIQDFFGALFAFSPLILIIITACEIIGAILLFFNFKLKFGVFLLILSFIISTILVHSFWFYDGAKRELEMVLFVKNLAILGGLFFIAAQGGKKASAE